MMTVISAYSLESNFLPSHDFSLGEIAGAIDAAELDQVSAGGGSFPASWYRAHHLNPNPKVFSNTVFGPAVAVAAGIAFVVVVIA